VNNQSSYICTAANAYCLYDAATATRTCQACGGMGQPCCGATSTAAGSGATGICGTGLACKLATAGTAYQCLP
jgi:hypothetical protein